MSEHETFSRGVVICRRCGASYSSTDQEAFGLAVGTEVWHNEAQCGRRRRAESFSIFLYIALIYVPFAFKDPLFETIGWVGALLSGGLFGFSITMLVNTLIRKHLRGWV